MNVQRVSYKAQRSKLDSYIVYPHAEGEVKYTIQSNKRIARINVETGKMVLSKSRSNGSYGIDLMEIRGAKEIEAPESLIADLKALPRTGKIVRLT